MPRDRIQLDLNSPLAREREGVKLTARSLSSRLAEIIERLGAVTAAAMPRTIPHEAWPLILWQGWDAIETERMMSRERPQDVDTLAWSTLTQEIAGWIASHGDEPAPAWSIGLVERLDALSPVERIAVLERIEAYGRTSAA